MEALFATVLWVTLVTCPNGPVGADRKCEDGSSARVQDVRVLTRDADGYATLEIREGDVIKFRLAPDGGVVKTDYDYQPDDAALAFWRAFAAVYAKTCPPLADALHELHSK